MLADPPHVMKRLRNNILDRGVTTTAGGKVNRTLMSDLLAIDGRAELRILPKLHVTSHVEVRIKLARSEQRYLRQGVEGSRLGGVPHTSENWRGQTPALAGTELCYN